MNAAEPQYGFTAMQTAIFNGHYAFAKLLIEKGADVNDGSLYIAIEMRNLAKYTQPAQSARGGDGRQPHGRGQAAARQGRRSPTLPYTKTMPPRQAQGNINVAPGSTPLYRAVRAIDLAAVKLLVDGGANPSQASRMARRR